MILPVAGLHGAQRVPHQIPHLDHLPGRGLERLHGVELSICSDIHRVFCGHRAGGGQAAEHQTEEKSRSVLLESLQLFSCVVYSASGPRGEGGLVTE